MTLNVWERAADILESQSADIQIPWREIARPEQLLPQTEWRTWYLQGSRGAGKLLDLDTAIPTPHGFKPLRHIAAGDEVFDEQGRICRVTGVHDNWSERAWRVEFSDHSYLIAGGEHLWMTWDHSARVAWNNHGDGSALPEDWPNWRTKNRSVRETLNGPFVRSTDEIQATLTQGKRGDRNHSIPVAYPLVIEDPWPLPMDPWLLGFWLGDGDSASATLTVGSEDEAWVRGRLAALKLRTSDQKRTKTEAARISIHGLHGSLTKLGVRKNKHVPQVYLWRPAWERLALLQGLMDSDGYADARKNTVEFTSTKEGLAQAVVTLARSLGEKPVIAKGRATLSGIDCGPKWRVTWRPTRSVPFALPRKRERIAFLKAQQSRHYHRMITGVTPVPVRPMRCLSVDSPNHLFLAGEAMIPTHNTRSAAEALAELIEQFPGGGWGVVAPTYADARDICMEGPSGLLIALGAQAPQWKGGLVANWNRSIGEAKLTNGATVWIDGADDGAPGIQGKNLRGLWADEVGKWLAGKKTARTRAKWEMAWDESIQFAVRLAPAKIIASGTPKAGHGLVKRLVADDSVPKSRLYLKDNEANLDPGAVAELRRLYEGTRLGRQELEGELIEDVEGALWTWEMIEPYRIDPESSPDEARAILQQLRRIVVAVDPSWGTKGDECGIGVAGLGWDGRGYILDDRSLRATPSQWGSVAAEAYHNWKADRLLAEVNFQGEQVRLVMQTTDPTIPVKEIRVTRGKALRAEPVVGLYEQGKVTHLGRFGGLEQQQTEWVPDESDFSPDRVDWCTMALTELMLDAAGPMTSSSPVGRKMGRVTR